jgi:hypothetical protein
MVMVEAGHGEQWEDHDEASRVSSLAEAVIESSLMLLKLKDGYFTTTTSSSLYTSYKKESTVLLLLQVLIH